MVGTLVMAPKSVTFRRHDHLVSVLFGDLLSHSYNITFSMFLYLVNLDVGMASQVKSPKSVDTRSQQSIGDTSLANTRRLTWLSM